MFPKVIFTIDKQYDKESTLEFLDDRDGFLNFGYERNNMTLSGTGKIQISKQRDSKKAIGQYHDKVYKQKGK